MKRSFFIIIFALTIKLGFSCTCIHTTEYTLQKEFKETDLVFTGTVIKIDTVHINSSELNFEQDEIWYTFKITESFKGKKKNKTIRIRSGNVDWDDCKYEFKINESYVVYANHPLKENFKKDKTILETTNCTNTGEATEEKILEVKKLVKG